MQFRALQLASFCRRVSHACNYDVIMVDSMQAGVPTGVFVNAHFLWHSFVALNWLTGGLNLVELTGGTQETHVWVMMLNPGYARAIWVGCTVVLCFSLCLTGARSGYLI